LPGKAPNVHRDFGAIHAHYMGKYFWPVEMLRPNTTVCGPRQPEHAFERRFRMPRLVFDRVLTKVVAASEYFRRGLRPDATGRLGITPLIKVIVALRQLAYGIPSDLCDDMFAVSETTAAECMYEFCCQVVSCFGNKYLREPTIDDLKQIERRFSEVGFPGCIGCVDCAGWFWKNAPKAMHGSLAGKDGKPTLRMEVICDLDLSIWSFQFGFPGVYNDLNILSVSDHFCNMLSGTFPPFTPKYRINGDDFAWF
jgi:Plant transposon protein